MKVLFVGAGPGDPELLTVKASKILCSCAICIYTGSLISPQVLELIPSTAEAYDSATMDLQHVFAVYEDAYKRNIDVVRLHTGDPSIFSTIGEQIVGLKARGIDYEIIAGVSSFQASAAMLGVELTAPEISQTVILTRTSGRTPMPQKQQLAALASTDSTLCIFLSVHNIEHISNELAQWYGLNCPCALVYHATWPDQKIIRAPLSEIATHVKLAGIDKHAMIIVGKTLEPTVAASKLYDSRFSHGYRKASME